MSTALQDTMRKTPPRTLTAQQPTGNVWTTTYFGNADTQLTVGISRKGLPETAPEPFIAATVPTVIEIQITAVETETPELLFASVPPGPHRFEVIIDYPFFADGGNFIIELPELPLVDIDNNRLGTVPAKSILISNVRP